MWWLTLPNVLPSSRANGLRFAGRNHFTASEIANWILRIQRFRRISSANRQFRKSLRPLSHDSDTRCEIIVRDNNFPPPRRPYSKLIYFSPLLLRTEDLCETANSRSTESRAVFNVFPKRRRSRFATATRDNRSLPAIMT